MLFAIKSVSNLQKDNAITGRINYLHEIETSNNNNNNNNNNHKNNNNHNHNHNPNHNNNNNNIVLFSSY